MEFLKVCQTNHHPAHQTQSEIDENNDFTNATEFYREIWQQAVEGGHTELSLKDYVQDCLDYQDGEYPGHDCSYSELHDEAKKHFDDQAQFYEVLERALHNYLKAKLKIETTELSKSKIKNLLHQNSVDKKTALEYVEVIESCERARYSPESLVNMKEDFKNASSLIGKIDRQI